MTDHRTLLACGEHAVLVELGGLDDVLPFADAVREAVAARAPGLTDVVDIVPAARTVLVVVHDNVPVAPVRQALTVLPIAEAGKAPSSEEVVEIPVRYDGPDLLEVSEITGLGVPEIIAAHTRSDWRVAFGGFAPGFAYLGWGDPRLAVPRRQEPRTSVPAGIINWP